MKDQIFKISKQPKFPFANRTLVLNTKVYKLKENVQYAKVMFDLIFTDASGIPADGMSNQTREFLVSNDHWVDTTTGMKVTDPTTFDKSGVPSTSVTNPDGTITYTAIPNLARQFDFFQTLVDSKAATVYELVAKYVAQCDAIQYFD